MTTDTNTSVQSRTMSAFFDTQAAATKAVDDLVLAGIPRQQISETSGQDGSELDTAPARTEEKGFWESLKEMFLPEEDRYAYEEGLRRGGYLVAVRTDEANYERVLDILDNDGAVNLDERENQWRSEGWTGFAGGNTASVMGLSSGMLAADPASAIGSETNYRTDTAARAAATGTMPPASTLGQTKAGMTSPLASGQDGVTPVYEENLQAGQRDATHGRTRVRSYLSDTAVNEQVGLRNENVQVEQPTTMSGSNVMAAMDSSRIVEHMDVISWDGQKIGTVDHLDGPDRIKLAKNTSPDGEHHIVPFAWIDHVDQHVHLRKTTAEVEAGW